MNIEDSKKRFEAAQKILSEQSTTVEKVESIFTLLRGTHPKIEKILVPASQAFANLKKFHQGEIIELTAENLPAEGEEQKKKKKALILFLKTWKDLRGEVKRVKAELESGQTGLDQVSSFAKIAAYAKGPFGIITIAAILIAVTLLIINNNKAKPGIENNVTQSTNSPKTKIQVIEFQSKKIPLTEVEVREGPDCNAPHYHALDHTSAKALDGSIVTDPGSCAFGKASEVQILEIEQ